MNTKLERTKPVEDKNRTLKSLKHRYSETKRKTIESAIQTSDATDKGKKEKIENKTVTIGG